MRLDKFLKVSRLIKRRTCLLYTSDAADIIEIAFGQKTVKVKVLNLLDTTKKEEAKDLFEYI